MIGRKKLLLLLLAITVLLSIATGYLQILEFRSDSLNTLPADVLWKKTYGGSGDNRVYCMVNFGGGGFLIAGSSTSVVPGRTVGLLVRISSDGDLVWNQTYVTQSGCELRKIVSLDNGFLIVGNIFLAADKITGWILRIDASGNELWNRTLGGIGINKLFTAVVGFDGYILAGLTYPNGSVSSNAWIIKTDFQGSIMWNNTYGSSQESGFHSILAVENEGFVVAGYTASASGGDNDFWLVKINNDGAILWNKSYGGPKRDVAYDLSKAKDGYVLVGETFSLGEGDADSLVVKTDFSGNLVWEQAYGGNNFDHSSAVIQSNDEGYIIAGTTFSYGAGNRDFWVFKINDKGEVQWSLTQGDSDYEEAYAVLQVSQTSYVIAGWKGLGVGHYDFYVIKINVDHQDPAGNRIVYVAIIAVAISACALSATFWFYRKK
jgi:hypothetical protein